MCQNIEMGDWPGRILRGRLAIEIKVGSLIWHAPTKLGAFNNFLLLFYHINATIANTHTHHWLLDKLWPIGKSRGYLDSPQLLAQNRGESGLASIYHKLPQNFKKLGCPTRSRSQFVKKSGWPSGSQSPPDPILVEILPPSRYLALSWYTHTHTYISLHVIHF